MSYDKEFLSISLDEVIEKAKQKKALYDIKKQELYNKNKRLAEIDNELLKIGPILGVAALSGDTKKIEEAKNTVEKLSAEKNEILVKENFKDYEPSCKFCNDSGLINGKYCNCVKKLAKQKSLLNLGECANLDCDFDNFSLSYYPEKFKDGVAKIYNLCKDYAENFSLNSKSLMLMGNTGLGKTHLSISIAKKVIDKGFSVIYGPADTILGKIEKEHFNYSANTPYKDSVLNCDLLIIDDLGTEFLTKYTLSVVYNIINNRILTSKPTIISTNFSIDEIEEKYTPRILSRIMGSYTVKLLQGNDIRQLKNK